MTTFNPSAQQATFFEWVETGCGSCVLIAVAGAGKSTTIRRALLHIPERQHVLMLSFNYDITADNKAKVAELMTEAGRGARNVSIKTFHGLGYSAILKRLNLKADAVKPDGKKLFNVLRHHLKQSALKQGYADTVADDLVEEKMAVYASYVTKLTALAMGEGIGVLVPDTVERWYALASHHDLQLDTDDADEKHAIDLARRLRLWGVEAAKNGHLSFDDMLYLPLLWKLRLWQHDWVFIDEAQDTNPVRRALAKLALRPGGRLVAVGDPNQAIYGFTGASYDAIDIIRREFNAIELGLTVSYRCSRAAVKRAQTIVSHIEPAETAVAGTDAALKLDDVLGILTNQDAILCRQTAPLVSLAYRLISGGRACAILGREIGTGLVDLIKAQRAAGIKKLIEKLETYREREVARHTGRGEEQKAEAVVDRVECVMTVIGRLPETKRTVPELIRQIESMFTDTAGNVLTLATVHKAKGKEWQNVAILRPELMPSKWARQEWQAQQEQNLMYVAWTRTMDGLYDIVA